MGDFANGPIMKILSSALAVIVIGINIFFVSETLSEQLTAGTHWLVYAGIFVGVAFYALFVVYLAIYLLITLGFESLVHLKWVQKAYNVQEYLEEKKIQK